MRVRIGGRMVKIKASREGQICGSGDLQGMKSSKKNRRACKARVAGLKSRKSNPKQPKPKVTKQKINTKKGKVTNREKVGFRSY